VTVVVAVGVIVWARSADAVAVTTATLDTIGSAVAVTGDVGAMSLGGVLGDDVPVVAVERPSIARRAKNPTAARMTTSATTPPTMNIHAPPRAPPPSRVIGTVETWTGLATTGAGGGATGSIRAVSFEGGRGAIGCACRVSALRSTTSGGVTTCIVSAVGATGWVGATIPAGGPMMTVAPPGASIVGPTRACGVSGRVPPDGPSDTGSTSRGDTASVAFFAVSGTDETTGDAVDTSLAREICPTRVRFSSRSAFAKA
jgi:hypothetical protein